MGFSTEKCEASFAVVMLQTGGKYLGCTVTCSRQCVRGLKCVSMSLGARNRKKERDVEERDM